MNDSATLLGDTSDLYHSEIEFVLSNIKNDHLGFWSRSLIRLTVTFFESEIFILKKNLLKHCEENRISLSVQVTTLLNGKKYEIDDQGRVKEQYLQIKLSNDIKFTYAQIINIRDFRLKSEFSDIRWNKIAKTIKVRNRLTHPKKIEDQVVTQDEITECMQAYFWFHENNYYFYQQELDFLEEQNERTKSQLSDLKKMVSIKKST